MLIQSIKSKIDLVNFHMICYIHVQSRFTASPTLEDGASKLFLKITVHSHRHLSSSLCRLTWSAYQKPHPKRNTQEDGGNEVVWSWEWGFTYHPFEGRVPNCSAIISSRHAQPFQQRSGFSPSCAATSQWISAHWWSTFHRVNELLTVVWILEISTQDLHKVWETSPFIWLW